MGGIPPQYEVIVERNLFSPSRMYLPPPKKKSSQSNIKIEEIKRGIIFRGVFRAGDQVYAVLEIAPHLKKKWNLSKHTKVFKEAERVGPCTIDKIERGKVTFGGECGGLELLLADSPERKRKKPQKISLNESSKRRQRNKEKKPKVFLERVKKSREKK